MKIHPLGAKLCHADEQTVLMKLIDVSRIFANTPKNRENDYGKQYSVNLPVDLSCNEQSVHVRMFVV
jgi:hypothetical protein